MRPSPLNVRAALLARLPEQMPAPDLWRRIAQRHVHRQRRRHLRLGSALAASLMLLVLAWSSTAPKPGVTSETMVLEAQSQRLEARLLELTASRASPQFPTELRSIERSLQRAYDRAAPETELAPLWRERIAILNTLIAAHAPGVMITRI